MTARNVPEAGTGGAAPRHDGLMDQSEFQRRIEGYIGRDLPDLAADRSRIAAALARPLWQHIVAPLEADRGILQVQWRWVGQRLHEEWPEVAEQLQLERTGTREGWG